MKHTLLAAAVALFGSFGAASASTIDFTVDIPGSSVSIDSQSCGIFGTCSVAADLATPISPLSFSLAEGETQEIEFIELTFFGTGVGSADISATLAFSAPPISSSDTGSGSYIVIGGTINLDAGGGFLTWDNGPQQYVLADGSVVEIAFEEVSGLFLGDPVTIDAYVTAISIVPLPAGGVLLLTGLVAIPAMRRRKKAA